MYRFSFSEQHLVWKSINRYCSSNWESYTKSVAWVL